MEKFFRKTFIWKSEEKTRKLPISRFCLIKLLICLVTSLKRLILTGNSHWLITLIKRLIQIGNFQEFSHYFQNNSFKRSLWVASSEMLIVFVTSEFKFIGHRWQDQNKNAFDKNCCIKCDEPCGQEEPSVVPRGLDKLIKYIDFTHDERLRLHLSDIEKKDIYQWNETLGRYCSNNI